MTGTTPNQGDEARRQHLATAIQTLDLPIPAESQSRLIAYLALMHRWNRVYNLTAVRSIDDMLSLHVVDSLAIVPAISAHANAAGLRILDVGSGGGLPGAVLAICRPDWSVTCVDASAKKSAFVRQVAAELALPNLQAVHARVEAMPSIPDQRFDLITSRAFASLADFTTLTQTHMMPGGAWLAMKGSPTADELAAVPPNVEVFHVEPISVPGLDAKRCIVWLRQRDPTHS